MTPRDPNTPVELEGVPDEEAVSEADAAERVRLSPEEQPNATDPDNPRKPEVEEER